MRISFPDEMMDVRFETRRKSARQKTEPRSKR
jgi:hypothetical protein